MRRSSGLAGAASFAALALVTPAFALSDQATGFAIDPPAPYVASPSSHPRQDVTFGVDSSTGKPAIHGTSEHLCGASFKAAEANNSLTQKQINKLVDDRDWRQTARGIVGALMTIDSEKTFQLKGARGVEYLVTPKIGPDHENVSMMMAMIDVPQGRVTFTCAAQKDEFKAALESFRAVRATITLPR